MIIPNTIQAMNQMGFPTETMTTIKGGVNVKIKAGYDIIVHPILELLIFSKLSLENSDNILPLLGAQINMFKNSMEMHHEFNDEILRRFTTNMLKIQSVIEEDPNYLKELEEIQGKYLPRIQRVFDDLNIE